jgi:hypothetical protein
VWWALALVVVAGCSDDALTELVVSVDSDLAVPGELQSVHLRVEGPSGTLALDDTVDLTAAAAPGLPLTLSLTPGSAELAPVVIAATGEGPAGAVQAWVETGFVAGERRMVRLSLLLACLDVICGVGETCGVGGECEDAHVPPDALPPWTGDPGHFDAGVAVDAGADAAVDAGPTTDAASDGEVPTDAAVDAEGDAGCMGDQDCPEDWTGGCIDDCAGCTELSTDCSGTCEREVITYTCVEGSCVPTEGQETIDCVCVGMSCDPEDLCVESATCSLNGQCMGPAKWCPDGCTCEPGSGICMGDGEQVLCPAH